MPARPTPEVAAAVQEVLDNPLGCVKEIAKRHGVHPETVRKKLRKINQGGRRVLQVRQNNIIRSPQQFKHGKVSLRRTSVGPVAIDDAEYLLDNENAGEARRSNSSSERKRRRASNDKHYRKKFRLAFREAQDLTRDTKVTLSGPAVCRLVIWHDHLFCFANCASLTSVFFRPPRMS